MIELNAETNDHSKGELIPIGEKSVSGRRAPTSEAPAGPMEAANLVTKFSEEERKQMGSTCLRDYDGDVSSRSGRMKKLRDFTEIYALVSKPKNFPFQKAANVMTPVLTGPTLQIQARLFDMIWPADGKIVFSQPVSIADIQIATITEKFANSYIRYKMPEMSQGLEDTLHQLCLFGSAFRRTYWNAAEARVCSDWIPIEDFVVAHSQRSQDPSLRDVPRYTMVQHLTIYDLESYADAGIYANVDGLRASDADMSTRKHSELSATVEKLDGSTPSTETSDEDKPRQVLEMHRIWRMPNRPEEHPAFDGKPHPVMITIDEASERVLRVALREEDDPDDRRRFEREQQKYVEYANSLRTYATAKEQFDGVIAAAQAMGREIPPEVMQSAPKMPEEAQPPKPIRKREICFFTHYRAFQSEGFYGLGYGDLLYGLARATNTVINQHIDGVTLRNAKPGFMSRALRGQRGSINVQPGEIIEVDAPASVIRDAIYFLDPPLNDPTTVPLINLFQAMADKMSGNSDIMSGQVPGSNQTAKGMQLLVEQTMIPITVFARRVKESFKHELEKIWRLWGVFLSDDEIADVVNDDGTPLQVRVGRWMFTPNARVVPASDPRIKSQRVEETQTIFQAVTTNPYIMQSPNAPAVLEAVTADLLRALGADKIVPLLPKPPEQPQEPQPPPPPKQQWEENAGFLRGQDTPVHPDDDDDGHMNDLMMFLQSPEGQKLDKPGRDMAERHMRFHQASAIEKRGAALGRAGGNQLPGPPGGGGSPMAGPEGGPVVPGPVGPGTGGGPGPNMPPGIDMPAQ